MKTVATATLSRINSPDDSADQWLKASAPPAEAKNKLLQQINFKLGTFNDKDRTFSAIASTPMVDRQGEIVDQGSWKIDNFASNPVIPWAHDYCQLPVARAIEIGVSGGILQFTYQAPPKGMYEFADIVWNYYRNQYLFAFSVGFIPGIIEWPEYDDNEGVFEVGSEMKLEREPIILKDNELLEISAVVVPANAGALALAYKMGVTDKRQTKQMLDKLKLTTATMEKALAIEEQKEVEGKDAQKWVAELTEDSIAAAVERGMTDAIEKLAEILSGGTETKGALSSNLPIADKGTSWDKGSAVSAVKAWASNGDGEIDFSKYKKAFMWVDSSNADKQGGYKLPFATVSDGELKAVWNAVKAIAGVLNGARGGVDIPDADLEKVHAQVVKYYKKFGEEPPEYNPKGLTDNNETGDSKDMATKEKAGASISAANRAKVKAVHDSLKSMATTLSSHASNFQKKATDIQDKADMLSEHVVTLNSLLPTNADNGTSNGDNDGDADQGKGIEDTTDKALDASETKQSEEVATEASETEANSGDVKEPDAEDASGDGADQEAEGKDDTSSEGAVEEDSEAEEDKESEGDKAETKSTESKETKTKAAPDDEIVDPDNLTEGQVEELVRTANEELSKLKGKQ